MPTLAFPVRLTSAILLAALAAPTTAQGSVRSYGAGTAGTGAFVPDHWVDSTPFVGNSGFHLTVDRGLGFSFAIAGIGFAEASVPAFGVEILIDPGQLVTLPFEVTSGSGAGNGGAAFALPLPGQPSLLGQQLRSQIFVLDAGSPGGFLSASQGVALSLALPGLVLANTSVGGSTDPQYAIDVASGAVIDFSNGTVNNSPRHAFSIDGSTAFVGQNLGTTNIQAFDASTSSPGALATTNLTGPGFPWVIRAHPDGERLYVIPNAPAGSVPIAEVLDADAASPSFLQPHAVGNLPMTGLLDAVAFEFDQSGEFGFAAMLGFISPGGSEVVKFDLRPGSPTLHQIVDRVALPSLIWAMTSTPDGDRLLAFSSGFGSSTGTIAVIDTDTLAIEDADPATPGTQPIGGELSGPRTPIDGDITSLCVGPRQRSVWLGGIGRVDRLVFDADDPAYLSLTSSPAGIGNDFIWGVDASDAGDRIYLTTSAAIEERDALSLALLRAFATPSPTTGVVVR